MGDLRPPAAVWFGTFAAPATLTAPNGSPTAITSVWLGAQPAGRAAGAGGATVNDQRPRLALRRSEVPSLLLRSTIVVPPLDGGAPKTYVVDEIDPTDAEVLIAVVHET
jgi:hypothetical protein